MICCVMLIQFYHQTLLIVQSVTIHLAVNHGLGRHMLSLSEKNFVAYSKVCTVLGLIVLAIKIYDWLYWLIGHVYQSDHLNCCSISIKNIFGPSLHTTNIIETDAVCFLSIYDLSHHMGCSCDHCSCATVSGTTFIQLITEHMSKPGTVDKRFSTAVFTLTIIPRVVYIMWMVLSVSSLTSLSLCFLQLSYRRLKSSLNNTGW